MSLPLPWRDRGRRVAHGRSVALRVVANTYQVGRGIAAAPIVGKPYDADALIGTTRVLSPRQHPPREATDQTPPGEGEPIPPRTSVLVLDDNVAIRAVVRQALEPEFAVFEARDATEAVAACRLVNPSIVMVDLLLPGGMSGQQFIGQYRRDGGRAKLLLFTGNQAADQIARELKVDGVIKKPFNVETLAADLRAFSSSR